MFGNDSNGREDTIGEKVCLVTQCVHDVSRASKPWVANDRVVSVTTAPIKTITSQLQPTRRVVVVSQADKTVQYRRILSKGSLSHDIRIIIRDAMSCVRGRGAGSMICSLTNSQEPPICDIGKFQQVTFSVGIVPTT